jgi:quercetin dioxygenase-like cupin family protein
MTDKENSELGATSGIPETRAVCVPSGADKYGEHRGLGVSMITFKVLTGGESGIFVLENTFTARGGPARHLHLEQEEWFYVTAGEFVMEIGAERMRLRRGDSVLAPRRVPHVWACAGDGRGSILVAFMPAGKMPEFFRMVTKANAMPPQDPALWRSHGMELLGPPLPVDSL